MKIKLLTICLLLFSSQAFSHDAFQGATVETNIEGVRIKKLECKKNNNGRYYYHGYISNNTNQNFFDDPEYGLYQWSLHWSNYDEDGEPIGSCHIGLGVIKGLPLLPMSGMELIDTQGLHGCQDATSVKFELQRMGKEN